MLATSSSAQMRRKRRIRSVLIATGWYVVRAAATCQRRFSSLRIYCAGARREACRFRRQAGEDVMVDVLPRTKYTPRVFVAVAGALIFQPLRAQK